MPTLGRHPTSKGKSILADVIPWHKSMTSSINVLVQMLKAARPSWIGSIRLDALHLLGRTHCNISPCPARKLFQQRRAF
jgi:hypothetical protein